MNFCQRYESYYVGEYSKSGTLRWEKKNEENYAHYHHSDDDNVDDDYMVGS